MAEILVISAAPTSAILPWLLPIFIAALGSVGIVWSRHLKKDEWDIVEESEETS
jgi:hypothetical protein